MMQMRLQYYFRNAEPSFTKMYQPNVSVPELSYEELKAAFLQAFQILKNVSMEESGVDITSSGLLYPDFLEFTTHEPIGDAAYEVGIWVYQRWTPHEMITTFSQILDESSANVSHLKQTTCDQNLLIFDYSFYHFDVQTRSKTHVNSIPMDFMGATLSLRKS
jgi:hypothetical protein